MRTSAPPAGERRTRGRRSVRLPTALRRSLVLAALVAVAGPPLIPVEPAFAAELVMFESSFCEWCEAWDRDVGVVYPKTEEGRLAPLRRVALHGPRPEDLVMIDAVVYTPTFVLVDRGRELGRITGYPGEDHFWGLLDVLLERLRAAAGPRPAGPPAVGCSGSESRHLEATSC